MQCTLGTVSNEFSFSTDREMADSFVNHDELFRSKLKYYKGTVSYSVSQSYQNFSL